MPTIAKRILEVKIIRRMDDDPDTSYLGNYSNTATSEFSIDRIHSEDCASIQPINESARQTLRNARSHVVDLQSGLSDGTTVLDVNEWEYLEQAYTILDELADDNAECDCGSHCVSSRELRYFNPSFNYVTKEDKPADNLTPEDIRNYVRQDYDRMEALNNGSWCYLGVSAVAEVLTNSGSIQVVQKITSGGLWGLESDSDREYLASVSNDELDNLKHELAALGFSKRAISRAFSSEIETVNR